MSKRFQESVEYLAEETKTVYYAAEDQVRSTLSVTSKQLEPKVTNKLSLKQNYEKFSRNIQAVS